MAGIDKIYGSNKEWDELFVWLARNRPQYVKYLYGAFSQIGEPRAISNFPTYADKWLYKNCPLKWARARIAEQYNWSKDMSEECPACKGQGKVARPAFRDSAKDVMVSCSVCKGKRILPQDPQDRIAELEAKLTTTKEQPCPFCQASAIREGELQAKLAEAEQDNEAMREQNLRMNKRIVEELEPALAAAAWMQEEAAKRHADWSKLSAAKLRKKYPECAALFDGSHLGVEFIRSIDPLTVGKELLESTRREAIAVAIHFFDKPLYPMVREPLQKALREHMASALLPKEPT